MNKNREEVNALAARFREVVSETERHLSPREPAAGSVEGAHRVILTSGNAGALAACPAGSLLEDAAAILADVPWTPTERPVVYYSSVRLGEDRPQAGEVVVKRGVTTRDSVLGEFFTVYFVRAPGRTLVARLADNSLTHLPKYLFLKEVIRLAGEIEQVDFVEVG